MNLLRTISSARKRAPTISGVAFPGDPIHSTQSGQWYVDDVAIVGETGTVFYPGADDVGKPVRQKNSNVLVVWSPMDYSPALWLSDTGTNPAQWDDLSGNGRHATQAAGASQPSIVTGAINGRQVRRFDGTDDLLRLDLGTSFSQPVEMSFIVKKTGNAATFNARVFHSSSSPSVEQNLFFPLGFETLGKYIWNLGSERIETEDFSTTPAHYGVLASGATSVIRKNGSVIVSGNVGSNALARYCSVGGRHHDGLRNFNGDIAEIIIYPTALSTTDRQRVERYLSAKYAIPLA